jgi:PKD domain-containing protein/peptidase M23-like protein
MNSLTASMVASLFCGVVTSLVLSTAWGVEERVSAQVRADGLSQSVRLPIVRVVDLNVGDSQMVELHGGSKATVKLLEVEEIRDNVRSAVRIGRVKVEVNGQSITLNSGNYNLPITIADVQIDCTITKGYYQDTNTDRWGLDKDVRLRLWPAGSPLIAPGTFVYPLKQSWFASLTWMSNEPVDGGRNIPKSVYYHSGLDFGGSEGQVDVLSATDGLVVARGLEILDDYEDSPVYRLTPRADVVYVFDDRGWFYRYSHLLSIDPGIRSGQRVKMGRKIGILGKEGGSGGWSHLHFEIKSIQPSGKWGTQDSYAFIWEVYRRQYRPQLLAVARPGHLIWPGEKVFLDGTRSWSARGKINSYEWTFDDGDTAIGAKVAKSYERPGTYSEILKITDAQGNVDYDFAKVMVVDQTQPKRFPPYIHAVYHPTFGIKAGDPITFKVRSFYVTEGQEEWDFGDGSGKVRVKSDGNQDMHNPEGYAVTTHRYQKPGHYIVRVERSNKQGHKAVTHLQVRVVTKN